MGAQHKGRRKLLLIHVQTLTSPGYLHPALAEQPFRSAWQPRFIILLHKVKATNFTFLSCTSDTASNFFFLSFFVFFSPNWSECRLVGEVLFLPQTQVRTYISETVSLVLMRRQRQC